MCNLLGSQVQAIITYPKLAKEFSKSALLCSELAKSKENAATAKVPWPNLLNIELQCMVCGWVADQRKHCPRCARQHILNIIILTPTLPLIQIRGMRFIQILYSSNKVCGITHGVVWLLMFLCFLFDIKLLKLCKNLSKFRFGQTCLV